MASQVATRIGTNLKTARNRAGLTQRQLAERIGTDSFQVSRWERGANRPQDDTLAALAFALGVDLVSFYAAPERDAA